MATSRSRRGRGEGSIYQRESDGRWVGVIDLGMIGKKRVRRTVTAATKRELVPKFNKLKAQVASGVLTDETTVEQWMNHWLDTVAVERVRPSTMRGYRALTANWVIPHLGRLRLDKVRPDHLRALYATMRDGGAAGSRHNVHALLHRAFKIAERDGRIAFNPAERVDPPAVSSKTHGKLTLPEALTVLAALEGRPDAARWTVALLAGMRQGEALGLTWEHVDLEEGIIRVRQAAQRITGEGIRIVPLKSKTSMRDIPMVSPVRYALAAMPGPREGLVFGDGTTPVDSKKDWEQWRDLLKAAGVDHQPLHAARATTGSLLSEAKVPDKIIAEILGHAQVSTTQRHYIAGDDRVHRDAMGALEALLGGGRELAS